MFNTPQSQSVAQYMMNNYLRGIKQDIAFETGQQQPYYLPTAMRLGPVGSSIVDGSFRYKEMSGGVLQNNLAGSGMSGCGMDNMKRFVGGQGIRSLNGVEPSKAAGTQSYTTAKMDGSYSGSGVVSQDLAFGLSGSMKPLSIPKQDQEPESLAGVRRVHGGRRKMTMEEKKKWAEMMKQARMKKRGGKQETIHIDINSHKNEPNDDEKKGGRKKVWSQEERKAFAEKMKAAKAKKRGSGAIGTSVGGMKKHMKKGGAIQPVNTFTSKSSPKIGGMKQDVKSKLIEVLRNKKK